MNTMLLEGEGTAVMEPDQASLIIGIVTNNESPVKAQEENTTRSHNVIRALKTLGISEQNIRTNSYSIYPRYDYIEGVSTLKDYEVQHLLLVTVKDLSLLGLVYETALENGATTTHSMRLSLSNTETAYEEALSNALLGVQHKARSLSKSMGVKVNPIPLKIVERRIEEGTVFTPFAQKALSAEGGPPIEKGELTITAYVKALFHYVY
ncbi:SIMPL domain-containing protein [Priestia endophytica]|jgi:uncharacterized protein|uniref:SIMPL domain-containing protein n=1 Tax=Priestia endophytica TaxID=135735 RepID=UPI000F51BF8C|nr:SIMPL domain-containing protein [Priestia endophytica]RPK09487.1 hypothetical protein FH5_04350 [Priestia endophytica]